MSSDQPAVSADQCEGWRREFERGASPYEIARRNDVSRGTVFDHVTGECAHDGGLSVVRSAYDVSRQECAALRRQYDSGRSIDSLLERSGRRWKTLVTHLTGECDHDPTTRAPTTSKESILRRDRITPEDCARFRRKAKQSDSVMEVADEVESDYQVVIAHVNGECSHDVAVEPRTPDVRGQDVSESACAAMRESYRSDVEIEFEEVAEQYDCSPGTAERHVRFQCSHAPTDALATDVAAVEDLLDTGDDGGAGPFPPAAVASRPNVEDGDPEEAVPDLSPADPDRVETTRSRTVRNTELTHDLRRCTTTAVRSVGIDARGSRAGRTRRHTTSGRSGARTTGPTARATSSSSARTTTRTSTTGGCGSTPRRWRWVTPTTRRSTAGCCR